MQEEQTPEPPQEPSQSQQPPKDSLPNGPRPFYKRKVFFIIVALLTLLLILAGAWFMKYRNDSDTKKPSSSAAKQSKQSKQQARPANNAQLAPYDVVYSHETQQLGNGSGCTQMQASLLWKPLSGGAETNAATMAAQSVVSYHDIYKNKVLAVTDAACGSTNGTAVWYSEDAGKTYAKVFGGNPPAGADGAEWDQITSAKFSTDGSRIVIGFIAAGALNNTVKEINPATKTSSNLFTVNSRGVFVVGYNRTTHQLLYYNGCYNCDGNTFSKLRSHDTNANTDTVLFDDQTHITLQTSPNADLSKLMLIKGVAGDMLGGGGPFTIQEFTTANQTTTVLQTVNQDTAVLHAGYRSDGTRYYSKDATLYGLAANGTPTTLFTAAHPIQGVYYVGAAEAVLSTGESSSYNVIKATFNPAATTSLLTAEAYHTVFGVGWQ
ncbi:MAG TPA: hypothetical protein VIR03_02895 [Candidatus Saccharimonadales bacterium]